MAESNALVMIYVGQMFRMIEESSLGEGLLYHSTNSYSINCPAR